MRVTETRKQSLGARMAAAIGIPCERIQITIVPGEAVQVDIGDMMDGEFVVKSDVPADKQDAARTLARTMLQEER